MNSYPYSEAPFAHQVGFRRRAGQCTVFFMSNLPDQLDRSSAKASVLFTHTYSVH